MLSTHSSKFSTAEEMRFYHRPKNMYCIGKHLLIYNICTNYKILRLCVTKEEMQQAIIYLSLVNAISLVGKAKFMWRVDLFRQCLSGDTDFIPLARPSNNQNKSATIPPENILHISLRGHSLNMFVMVPQFTQTLLKPPYPKNTVCR